MKIDLIFPLKIYGIFTGACYDLFICAEVYIRLKKSSMGLHYRKRAILYHSLSNLLGILCAMTILTQYLTETHLE